MDLYENTSFVYTIYSHTRRGTKILCTRPSEHRNAPRRLTALGWRFETSNAHLERSGVHTRLLVPYTVNFCSIASSFATPLPQSSVAREIRSRIVPEIAHPGF